MIFVSSFRPFKNCPPEIWDQQVTANRSWVQVVPQVFYFNEREPRMADAKVAFLPTQGKPSIKQMAAFCAGLNDWSAIINADIYVPQSFRRAEDALRGRQSGCAISRRYTLDSSGDPSTGALRDNGLDFFAATPSVWKLAAEKIDPGFTLGRIVWDNWMLNFFMAEFGNYCYDLTPARVIFHPTHQDRVDQNWDVPKADPYLQKNNWPFHSIEI